jgi:hypothetical protein
MARKLTNTKATYVVVGMARTAARIAAMVVLSVSALTLPARAQTVHYGVVMDVPRLKLDSLWDDNPRQVERAYCVVDYSIGVHHVSRTSPVQDDSVFRVFAVVPANTRSAGPSSVDFECAPGKPELHTHTPSTCTGDDVKTCFAGGLNAFSCQPSREDLEKLVRRGDPFAVIQCDRRAFRFYYPSEYVDSAGRRLAAGKSASPTTSNVPLVFQPPKKERP